MDDIEVEVEAEAETAARIEVLTIFDGGYETQAVEGFAIRRIPLPATLYDRLDWKPSFAVAKDAIARGERILWDLDLGLFSRLPMPLSDEGQFRACTLAVEFLLHEIKDHFKDVTVGVCLYRGSGDMRRGFPWEPGSAPVTAEAASAEKSLVICRDRCWEFLRQLVVNWPDHIPLFAMLDLRRLSPLTQLLLLERSQLGRFCPIVRGVSRCWQFPHLGWEEWAESGTLSRQLIVSPENSVQAHSDGSVRQGLLIPNEVIDPLTSTKWETLLCEMQQKGIVTRILSESYLTAEWDGLDQIFVSSQTNTLLAKRALQGFKAAGGEVLFI